MPTLIRCYACKDESSAGTMFDKNLTACPRCETPRRGFNVTLRVASLNNHLYAMADGSQERAGWMSAQDAAKEHAEQIFS